MKKIILAYDGGEPAKRALDMTVELARKFGASVAVVSMVARPSGSVSGGSMEVTARSICR